MKIWPGRSVSGKVRYLTPVEEAEIDRKVAAGDAIVLSQHPSSEDIEKMGESYSRDEIGRAGHE